MPKDKLDKDLALGVGRACLCFNLRKAGRLVTQLFDEALRPAGLKVTQFSVLMGVQAQEGSPLGLLAGRMGMDRTTLTRNLDILAARGLVALEAGEDRREQRAALTPQGRRVLEEALPHWRQAQEQVERLLGREGLADFLKRLRGLSAKLG